MPPSPETLCISILRRVAQEADARFAGLGIICYSDLVSLAYAPMTVPQTEVVSLPARGLDSLSSFLVRVSCFDSPLHDGFHLISTTTMTLTHACQFVAPSIPSKYHIAGLPAGARHAAALLASAAPGIDAAGLLTASGMAFVYASGSRVIEEKLR
jgi:hypothetical protein